MEHPIIQRYRELLSQAQIDSMSYAFGDVAKSLDPNTPSHKIRLSDLVYNIKILSCEGDPHKKPELEGLGNRIISILRERGYRTNIHTAQEHALLGSTVDPEYEQQPYKPIGVIKGEITVNEASIARALERIHTGRGRYFGLPKMFVTISLEPLDADGNSVKDPQVLDDKLEPIATTPTQDFPFRRV